MSYTPKIEGRARVGLIRLGDIICPQNGDFPAYSKSGAPELINEMIATAPSGDISDLCTVLGILSFLPEFALRKLIDAMTVSHGKGEGIWVLMRQLDFGIKGIILGTYYADKEVTAEPPRRPLDVIGFSIKRMPL